MIEVPKAPSKTRLEATVVVPTHRGGHRLPELLDALSKQDYQGLWETLIVVDGDLDNSVSILERYSDVLPLRYIVNKDPQGVTAVMNAGILAALGDVVIRCDDDLSPGPEYVSSHLKYHTGNTPVGVIGPTRDVFPDGAYARLYGRPASERSLAAAYARPTHLAWIGWAANNSAKREVLLAAGGFDAAFVYGQDSELGYRLARAGVEILVAPELEVEHRGPSTSASTRVPRAFISGASKRLFYQRHPEAIPPARPTRSMPDLVWRTAVRALAGSLRTREAFAKVGVLVDRLIEVAPASVGRRVIALAVESAGQSGRRNGADDLSTYKMQKTAELARELDRVG